MAMGGHTHAQTHRQTDRHTHTHTHTHTETHRQTAPRHAVHSNCSRRCDQASRACSSAPASHDLRAHSRPDARQRLESPFACSKIAPFGLERAVGRCRPGPLLSRCRRHLARENDTVSHSTAASAEARECLDGRGQDSRRRGRLGRRPRLGDLGKGLSLRSTVGSVFNCIVHPLHARENGVHHLHVHGGGNRLHAGTAGSDGGLPSIDSTPPVARVDRHRAARCAARRSLRRELTCQASLGPGR